MSSASGTGDGGDPVGSARSILIGGWRITPLVDGAMRLDGGAMWGVVPKPMWEKLTPPDADNSIAIAIREAINASRRRWSSWKKPNWLD